MNCSPISSVDGRGPGRVLPQIAGVDERYTDEIQGRHASIDVPVTVVWGRDDAWIPVDHAEELARLIPGAAFEIIDDAGHRIQFDAPVALATAPHRWLTARSTRR
ncbi:MULTISPECIES: alpha/beta fold hydrolase [unclassified Rhodococcus (in: high G+C Gram-positive bacteria)]|uniref:alpha/beta fold hydrolase n=1 Tax=unclassified Rhodococcus (in: high G+C Gram-positive bacteria) TaxID=192944 RepID=UPI00289F90AB|nr:MULTISPECIES: alpha/beta fold hydrolase [unclassified Rhodococcus (in: high G+C Gram-positive bacteria)]